MKKLYMCKKILWLLAIYGLQSVLAAKTPLTDFSYNHSKTIGGTYTMSTFGTNLPISGVLYSYMPLVFEGYFTLPLLKKAKRNQLAFYVQPSVVAVILKQRDYGMPGMGSLILSQADDGPYNRLGAIKVNWEIGAHAGFLHQVLLWSHFMFFYGLGSGPHYFPITNDHYESPTFIFASHILFGFKNRIALPKTEKYFEFSFLARYRHLSDAFIFRYNHGLDNIMLGFGLGYLLR